MRKQQSGNARRRANALAKWEARKDEIIRHYTEGTWSQAQLAEHFGVSQSGMSKIIRALGIAATPRHRSGDQNGRYRHGREARPYRSMVKKERCAKCGVRENLCVHHLDGDHFNNVRSNLQVLCMGCHSSMHKTEWWREQRKNG